MLLGTGAVDLDTDTLEELTKVSEEMLEKKSGGNVTNAIS